MKRLVIFGASDLALYARFYFSRDSAYEVAAFTVHESFMQGPEFGGLPLAAFESVEERYPPHRFDMFVAVGTKQLNKVRAEVCRAARDKGYRLATYLSSKAVYVGEVNCGDNCFILEGTVIQPFAKIGSGAIVWSGGHIGHDAVIEDCCFLAPHVVLCGFVRIGERSFIGANACVKHRVTIAPGCLIGSGAVILKNTKPGAAHLVKGTPAFALSADQVATLL
jgi:sugar O-acyltransferase (sialic acid O-acetyltransferase NeuD family)